MLSRLQLNAGSWLIHTQSSKSLNAACAAAASYCTHKTTMLKIAGPITGTGHKRVIGNALTGGTGTGTGTCTGTSTCALSLGGALFQPACGVIKWPTNRCLLFSSSRSVEKRSGRSVDGDIISSAADTSNTGQTKFQQVKGSLTEKLKHTAVNGHVDIAKRNTTLDAGFSKDAKELATASDKLQANEIYRSKINKGGKAKKNKLKTEKVDEKPFATINEQQLQVPVMETTVSDMPQAKFSPGERVDRDARPKKKTLETQKTDAKVSAKLQSKSSPRAKVDKAGQPEKKNLKIKETNEKDLDKQSQIAIGDSLMKVTISDKPQAKFGPRERADRDAPPKKKNLKIQKTDAKASGKLQTKSSLRSTVNKAGQPEKKNLKTQKTNEKDLDKQSQVAIGDSLMKLTISDKLQSKSNPRKKGNKADQPKKNNLKTKKNSAKLTQVVSSEMNSGGNKKKLAQDAGERPATNGNARYEDNGSTKLPKADKELLVNTKCGSDNEKEVNQKQKENAPTHAKGKVVVVVESETKAKTIQKYLGDEFVVLASYGHVRDLAPRAGSVRPSEDFIMIWEVPSTAWIHIKKIEEALTGARSLVLASDPDREGEAIAWHIIEVLKQQGSLKKNMIIQRVVFHEVTESAVQNAMLSPRDIYTSLVHARHARSALDYLIGFNISPLLWRKLPGCQSAGRVQSAALSLICDREKEIEKFVPQEYWSVEAKACTRELFLSGRNSAVLAKVTNVNGKKLEKLSINKKTEAEKVALNVSLSNFKVLDVKRINTKKNPPAPYITSTLQRDAANKLKLSATHTMKLAQKLYEGVKISDNEVSGLITYMRTDGLRISEEAAESIRMEVTECYGEDYAVKSIRTFAKKVKNAQEAHEAIRPTDIRRTPSMLASTLEKDLLKLYTLIWCQAMACQMQEAKINQISASFENEEKSVILRSSASAISFPGYLAVFQDNETLITKGEELQEEEEDGSFSYLSELKDKELIAKGEEIQQKEEDGNFSYLSKLKIGDLIYMNEVQPLQHFTEPPPRYSEGSLIEKLEGLGIGRPSTYAATIKTLQAREYITIRSRRIFPEFRGRMVSKFLSHYFPEIINYDFTAYMESQLDDISTGCSNWKNVLLKFWENFHPVCERVVKVENKEVRNMLADTFEDYLFGAHREKSRTCPECKTGTLTLKVTRHGAGYFIGCNAYPKCLHVAETLFSEEDKENRKEETPSRIEPKLLGTDPNSGFQVFLKYGPYGYYVQLGDDTNDWKPKRASISKIKALETIKLEDALELLRYPITLGKHPEDKKPVLLARMKYGFAVKHRHIIATVPKDLDPHSISMDMAIQYLKGKNTRMTGYHGQKGRRRGTKKVLES